MAPFTPWWGPFTREDPEGGSGWSTPFISSQRIYGRGSVFWDVPSSRCPLRLICVTQYLRAYWRDFNETNWHHMSGHCEKVFKVEGQGHGQLRRRTFRRCVVEAHLSQQCFLPTKSIVSGRPFRPLSVNAYFAWRDRPIYFSVDGFQWILPQIIISFGAEKMVTLNDLEPHNGCHSHEWALLKRFSRSGQGHDQMN